MSRRTVLDRPTKLTDLGFEQLYAEVSYDWRGKADRLQARRWRSIGRQASKPKIKKVPDDSIVERTKPQFII